MLFRGDVRTVGRITWGPYSCSLGLRPKRPVEHTPVWCGTHTLTAFLTKVFAPTPFPRVLYFGIDDLGGGWGGG